MSIFIRYVSGATALLQVPAHSALLQGGGSVEHLVATNWVRTAAWSLRGVLSLVMIAWAWGAWTGAAQRLSHEASEAR